MALAVSMELPPPRLTRLSCLPSTNARAPWSTASVVGSATEPAKTSQSMPLAKI